MIKRLFLLLLCAAAAQAHATTIAQVISPTRIVLAGTREREVLPVNGTPVYYCGLNAFTSWAAPLVGQQVMSTADTGVTVAVDAQKVSIERLLVDKGWLQPAKLDDDAQAAITEGRGGWAAYSSRTT